MLLLLPVTRVRLRVGVGANAAHAQRTRSFTPPPNSIYILTPRAATAPAARARATRGDKLRVMPAVHVPPAVGREARATPAAAPPRKEPPPPPPTAEVDAASRLPSSDPPPPPPLSGRSMLKASKTDRYREGGFWADVALREVVGEDTAAIVAAAVATVAAVTVGARGRQCVSMGMGAGRGPPGLTRTAAGPSMSCRSTVLSSVESVRRAKKRRRVGGTAGGAAAAGRTGPATPPGIRAPTETRDKEMRASPASRAEDARSTGGGG